MLPLSRTFKIYKMGVQAMVDFLFLNFSLGLVYLIRFKFLASHFDDNIKRLNGLEYLAFGVIFSCLVMVVFALTGVYEINRKRSILSRFWGISFGIFLTVFALVSFFFFNEFNIEIFPLGVPVSRFILLSSGFAGVFFVFLGRIILWLVSVFLRDFYGVGKIRICTVGDSSGGVLGHFQSQKNISNIAQHPVLTAETLEELRIKIINGELEEIYMFGLQDTILEGKLAWYSERYKVNFVFAPEGFGNSQFFDLQPRRINGKLFLELVHSNIDGWRVIFKRVFDIIFALTFLAMFSPIFLVISILIFWEDQAPVLYFSDRVGPDGKNFKLWKFRRLQWKYCTGVGTDKNVIKEAMEYEKQLIQEKDIRGDGVLYKIQDDPRNTRIGKFIERTSLDEIPQFVNVLLGNMSVVGPRPHQPREVAKYNNDHYKVLNIKPGITGMAQINGRSDLKFDQEVELDCYYIERWSFWLDIWIILKTPFVLIFGRHKS